MWLSSAHQNRHLTPAIGREREDADQQPEHNRGDHGDTPGRQRARWSWSGSLGSRIGQVGRRQAEAKEFTDRELCSPISMSLTKHWDSSNELLARHSSNRSRKARKPDCSGRNPCSAHRCLPRSFRMLRKRRKRIEARVKKVGESSSDGGATHGTWRTSISECSTNFCALSENIARDSCARHRGSCQRTLACTRACCNEGTRPHDSGSRLLADEASS